MKSSKVIASGVVAGVAVVGLIGSVAWAGDEADPGPNSAVATDALAATESSNADFASIDLSLYLEDNPAAEYVSSVIEGDTIKIRVTDALSTALAAEIASIEAKYDGVTFEIVIVEQSKDEREAAMQAVSSELVQIPEYVGIDPTKDGSPFVVGLDIDGPFPASITDQVEQIIQAEFPGQSVTFGHWENRPNGGAFIAEVSADTVGQ